MVVVRVYYSDIKNMLEQDVDLLEFLSQQMDLVLYLIVLVAAYGFVLFLYHQYTHTN